MRLGNIRGCFDLFVQILFTVAVTTNCNFEILRNPVLHLWLYNRLPLRLGGRLELDTKSTSINHRAELSLNRVPETDRLGSVTAVWIVVPWWTHWCLIRTVDLVVDPGAILMVVDPWGLGPILPSFKSFAQFGRQLQLGFYFGHQAVVGPLGRFDHRSGPHIRLYRAKRHKLVRLIMGSWYVGLTMLDSLQL